MRAWFLAILLVLIGQGAARAQQLVTQVSRDEVAITSSYTGETLTLFGTVAPETGSGEKHVEGPFHLVITITGPLQDRVVRQKNNVLGIWLNTRQAEFKKVPAFYHVLADTRLADISDPQTLAERAVPLEAQAFLTSTASWWDTMEFGSELVRLMQASGLYRLDEAAVIFRTDTFYYAQVQIPSDAPPGSYLVHSYVFKDGSLIADRANGFTVRKIGFERFLGQAATDYPWIYGLVCVLLALGTGVLGGIVFRR